MLLTKTNTSKIPSDIPSFNISDQLPNPNMTVCPSNLNSPCGLGIINVDNGRKQSKKNNNK
jgi:hypothetical protein